MPFPDPDNQFKEGESGNPHGRPKGSLNRSTIARKWLALLEKTDNQITGEKQELSQEELMTLAQILKAKKGDTKAYTALMDSGYGQPKQQISTEGITQIKIIRDSGNNSQSTPPEAGASPEGGETV